MTATNELLRPTKLEAKPETIPLTSAEIPSLAQAELNEKMEIKEISEKINGCLAILEF